ncbi:hypothetical protein [uncultured Thermanaerothrix sp.]|nr:hypothetical protein [uncultured Thermanaerothrix sp.]
MSKVLQVHYNTGKEGLGRGRTTWLSEGRGVRVGLFLSAWVGLHGLQIRL